MSKDIDQPIYNARPLLFINLSHYLVDPTLVY